MKRVAMLAVYTCLLLPALTPAVADAGPATSLEGLIARFKAMPGFSARFEDEKRIALLARPLRSRGTLYFVPPSLLLRRVDDPPSLLRLESDRLVFSDSRGSESLDLGANGVARVFANTFTNVLAGDLERLRAAYEIGFQPEKTGGDVAAADPDDAWHIELTPRDPALARAIAGLSLRGHGLVLLDLVVRESSGDSTLTRFEDVDATRRFEQAEITELLRPPGPTPEPAP
jgi:hypothetical protein